MMPGVDVVIDPSELEHLDEETLKRKYEEGLEVCCRSVFQLLVVIFFVVFCGTTC